MHKTFGKSFKYADELYFNVCKRISFGEETELSDIEVLGYLRELHNMNGMLYVITDYCYENKCGPFIINANQFEDFVKNFLQVYGEAFYSTDIIVINFTEKIIWVFFHEGICWLSRG